MKVSFLFPPNYREINKTFNVRGKPVIFAFGQTIFNPSRVKIPPELLAHEQVHSERQGDDPSTWWLDYLQDPEFRLREELPAHRAEYRDVCDRFTDRSAQQRYLHRIADCLSSPLYGSLIGYDEARERIAAL